MLPEQEVRDFAEWAGVPADNLVKRYQELHRAGYFPGDKGYRDYAAVALSAYSLAFGDDADAAYAEALTKLVSADPPVLPAGRTVEEVFDWVVARSGLDPAEARAAVDQVFGGGSPEPEKAPEPPAPEPRPERPERKPEPRSAPSASPAPAPARVELPKDLTLQLARIKELSTQLARVEARVATLERRLAEVDQLPKELAELKRRVEKIEEPLAKAVADLEALHEKLGDLGDVLHYIGQIQTVDNRVTKLEHEYKDTLAAMVRSMDRLVQDYKKLSEFYEQTLPALAGVKTKAEQATLWGRFRAFWWEVRYWLRPWLPVLLLVLVAILLLRYLRHLL